MTEKRDVTALTFKTSGGAVSTSGSQPPQRRLRVRAAKLMLAREMWARDHGTYDYTEWDQDHLLTDTYLRYFKKADDAIRFAMEQGWA